MKKLMLGLLLVVMSCDNIKKNNDYQVILNKALEIDALVINESEFEEHQGYNRTKYILINKLLEPLTENGDLNDTKSISLKKSEWFKNNKYPHFIDFFNLKIDNDSADVKYLYRSGNKEFTLKFIKSDSEWIINNIEVVNLPRMYMTDESELHKNIYRLLYPENENKTDLEIEKELLQKKGNR